MKDIVAKESYVERFAREQKEKMGIPASAESKEGIPSESEMGIPVEAEKGIPAQKEVKENGKDTRGKGQAAQAESDKRS